MKTFLQWRETTTVADATADSREIRGQYGATAFSGFQDIVHALQTLASADPQKFGIVVGKIRTVLSSEDKQAANLAMAGGRKFVSAVKRVGAED